MIEIILIKIGPKKQSKHGSYYIRCIFKCIKTDKSYRLDVYEGHDLSRRWQKYLIPQAVFSNVKVYKNNIIDGTSNFTFKYIKK